MTKQQKIGASLGVLVMVGAIIAAVNQPVRSSRSPVPAAEKTIKAEGGQGAAAKEALYTLVQVKEHATPESCWTAINGGVYNLTAWIEQHPGGAKEILRICGKDGSVAFNDQHAGGEQPLATLATFRIGSLTK